MACRPATAVIILLFSSLAAVAHSRPIEADPITNAVSAVAVAVPTEVLPSSDDVVSTEVVPVPAAGRESGLLQLPSEHSVVVYHQIAEAGDLGRQEEEDLLKAVAEPDPDRAQLAGISGVEQFTDGQESEEEEGEEELSRSHHAEDEDEDKERKRLRRKEDDDDSDSDSDSDDDDDDLEEKAKRWMKALKRRWFGHRKHHHHHGHRHTHGEAAMRADGEQEETGVMTWINGLMNRF